MNADLREYLVNLELMLEETAVWGNGRLPLKVDYYLTNMLPPDPYITSIRAILFQNNTVMTIHGPNGEHHIVPGGRRDAGETIFDTLQRELLEETGWRYQNSSLMALVHFHHLSPKPDDYPYPHPDFLQLVFIAEADTYHPELMEEDEWVEESDFYPIDKARELLNSKSQCFLLDEAIKLYF